MDAQGGSISEPVYKCNKCKDIGGLFESKYDEEVDKYYEIWVECECSRTRKVNNLLKSSEITDAFRNLTFGNFITEGRPQVVLDARECALAYYKAYEHIKGETANSIALLGQPGAGKTHLLTALSNNLIQKRLAKVLYFPFVEGFNDLRDDFEKLEAKMQRMKDVDVLFIDDLFKPVRGVPKATEWQLEQTYAVINHRYLNHKPVIISSELDFDQMIALDEALATRIVEMCENFTVIIEGDKKSLNYRIRNF